MPRGLAHQGAKPIPNTIASWANAGILDAVAERIMYIQGPPVPKWNAWLKELVVQYNFQVVEAQENTVFESLFVLDVKSKHEQTDMQKDMQYIQILVLDTYFIVASHLLRPK